jgi:hypothetical protein
MVKPRSPSRFLFDGDPDQELLSADISCHSTDIQLAVAGRVNQDVPRIASRTVAASAAAAEPWPTPEVSVGITSEVYSTASVEPDAKPWSPVFSESRLSAEESARRFDSIGVFAAAAGTGSATGQLQKMRH